MPAPREILELVARFEQQLDAYKSGQYNETQLRREFLDPLFKALGWDIDNTAGFAEAYKDVIHEDQIRIGSATKAPDYCFRVGGTRKFFLEAKKPSVDIKDEPSAAYQLRRYAWSAKLPLSVLGDFEEFAVYDGRVKPHKNDSASIARVFYCTFRDYAEKWDWIASIFSRDAVLKGSFDKYVESTRAKKGTAEFDQDFLATIENWRLELARNLAVRNPKLSQRELNFSVQRTIDRIIFLRICEDRGIENYGRLLALVNGDRVYPRLCQFFEQADARYNSGLFHFKKEPDRHETPDELTLELGIDDKLLREILHGLYYPESPYEFSVISADILGQVYEQFLGKVIRLTEGHRAVVDDKPEVKKAGGVYYTPTYIVDYIVRQTVGKLLDEALGSAGASPAAAGARADGSGLAAEQGLREGAQTDTRGACAPRDPRSASRILNRISKLRILDPACGSGSFLIGAYQFLLDWHLQFYLANDPVKWAREIRGKHPILVQSRKGDWQLSIAERKRILLANIYGVDIDAQAVEVTKLSLLLKVLEGEAQQAQVFFALKDRVLPDLGDNIKCGNSLIGPDFYRQAELPLLTDDEKYRINVFDWHAEFPQIFRRRESADELRESAAASPLDYTVPGVPLHGSYSHKKMKGEKAAPPPVPFDSQWEGGFDAVIGNPPYVLLQNEFRDENQLAYFKRHFTCASFKIDTYHLFIEQGIRLARARGRVSMITPSNFLTNNHLDRLRRLILERSSVDSILIPDGGVFHGISVDNAVLCLIAGKPSMKAFRLVHSNPKGGRLTHLFTTEVSPRQALAERHVLFTGATSGQAGLLWNRVSPISVPLGEIADVNFGKQLRDRSKYTNDVIEVSSARAVPRTHEPCYTGKDTRRYNLSWSHLACLRSEEARSGGCWDPSKHHARNKLLTRQIGRFPEFTLDINGWACLNTMFMVTLRESWPSPQFILGLLNSKVTQSLWLERFYDRRRTFPKVKGTYLKLLPVRRLNEGDRSDQAFHARMVMLVEQMMELHRHHAAARTPQEKTALERQIAATDAEIDRLVYELYGLTEDEIKIVEGTAA